MNSRPTTRYRLPLCIAGTNNARLTVSAARLSTQAGMRRAPNSLSEARPMRIGPASPATSKAEGTMAEATLPISGMRS